MPDLPIKDPWAAFARWTPARIGLGRVGCSTPTRATLDFSMDHARARDAIHTPFDVEQFVDRLEASGFRARHIWSQAHDRGEYLTRPDLGRALAPECRAQLEVESGGAANRLTVIVADGLSSLAPTLHALSLLQALRNQLLDWTFDTVFVATQARVALADEVGACRGSEASLILIGERPGLKSADSLGAYLTYRPRPGCTDADRNCISNIREDGLDSATACNQLLLLLEGARRLGKSGVHLKPGDEAARIIELPQSS